MVWRSDKKILEVHHTVKLDSNIGSHLRTRDKVDEWLSDDTMYIDPRINASEERGTHLKNPSHFDDPFQHQWTLGYNASCPISLETKLSLIIRPVETFTDNAAGVGLGQFDGGTLPEYGVAQYFYSDPLLSTTPSYPVFAEYADIYKPYVSRLDTLIDDTEPVIRALFPIATQENRSQLLSFDGNATLYDARWVCMPPHLEDLKLIGNWDGGVLSGSVNFSV
ncbi:hypothetical protein LTR70_002363 [Exophiala xenobiotica]|uniref:Uncharacterized protein n=1 Tax=Lithohypha guttulata TaxID=1690604 RepID=A0ABR0KKQ5_9EURO|nr:hypothetical protein LTR24_001360 [Lithohypha guttulata]KAK5325392.1 hypothetical protein LTR70_002363 [Exophiala xenobiotica]